MSRVLVTGVSTVWGGRVAQALERDPGVEAVVGVSPGDPACELTRTEFVRVATRQALLERLVRAARIDTVIDTRMIAGGGPTPPADAHEDDVIGTLHLLAACDGPGSPVRKVVFKSSAHVYGCSRRDPAYFTEDMDLAPPRTPAARDAVEAERAVQAFAARNPAVTVTVLRFADALGPDLRSAHTRLLSLPAVPAILGFDPRWQFAGEDDVVGALAHAARTQLPGVFNVAGDGVLALSEVATLLEKPLAPVLPPWGTGLTAGALRRLGLQLPPEVLDQLRYGRGLDNRRFKAAGYAFRATSREAVQAFAGHLRSHAGRPALGEGHRYDREVAEFLHRSPAVHGGEAPRPAAAQRGDLERAPAPRDRPVRLAPRGTLRTGSPSSSGGAADSELAADP